MGWVKHRLDKGVAPLVLALNRVRGMQTIESCQQTHRGMAEVALQFLEVDDARFVRNARNLALAIRRADSAISFGVRATWHGSQGVDHPLVWLWTAPGSVEQLAQAIECAVEKGWLRRETALDDGIRTLSKASGSSLATSRRRV
jgi:hypothetical protein